MKKEQLVFLAIGFAFGILVGFGVYNALDTAHIYGGGGEVLGALQAGAIATALPFTLVLLLCCVSLYLGLRHELDSLLSRAADSV